MSLWIIPTIIVCSLKKHIDTNAKEVNSGKLMNIYNIVDLYNVLNEDVIYSINFADEIIFDNSLDIELSIDNYDDKSKYIAEITLNNEKKEEIELVKENDINIELINEGKNEINIIINKNKEKKTEIIKDIYYIKPYQKQFLDELEKNGVNNKVTSNMDKELIIKLCKGLGINYIRYGIWWGYVEKNNKFDFSLYDDFVELLKQNDLKSFVILGAPMGILNGKSIVDSEESLTRYKDYVTAVKNQYDGIEYYEVENEPNGKYVSEELQGWYLKMINATNEILDDKSIVIGSTMMTESYVDSEIFLENIFKNDDGKKFNKISFHPYDAVPNVNNNWIIKNLLKKHSNLSNNYGGFNKFYISEYGVSNYADKITEKEQREKLIQQNVVLDQYSVDINLIYNLKNTGNNSNNIEHNWGLVDYDYKPKASYYVMKNYYENTNGAEYIGYIVNIENVIDDNVDAHVYDKDGKPKIIVWSKKKNEQIAIPYTNFKATDIYGEEIQPDENGNLVITTSPVYLDEVDYNYFYQAISNVAIEKYNEFTEKFAGEIAQIPELTSKIEENKKYMESVGQVENKIVGSATIQAMKNHFELGNLILQAYRDGKLQAEDVKISSMLDMLNDIGDSYEDLVTVSAQTVEQAEIEQTNKVIQEAETTINNNQGCEIIYPVKILDFAKDHYEKATYINSLEEENDIKNGLIISNNLHASLLANWANIFAQINIDKFVDEYIANNPVTIEYSTTELTNQNVKATIKTNAEIQITNNSNSKEHTFEQNGNFTFEYTIKGRALSITATVQNIDKVAPSISGVQKAKLYTKPVTPKINDENLKEIKLILNSHVVSNYKNGDTLEEEGFYELTATDKAGNTTTTYFQIFINNDTDYKIEENYIKNVTNNTKKSDFDKKLNLSVDYKIYRNETELKQDDIIATGDVLTTEAGDNYTIIVPGDINKDGKVDLKDFIKMRIYLLLENNLDDIEKLAADCNNDNQPIGVKDYIRMRLIILMQDSKSN